MPTRVIIFSPSRCTVTCMGSIAYNRFDYSRFAPLPLRLHSSQPRPCLSPRTGVPSAPTQAPLDAPTGAHTGALAASTYTCPISTPRIPTEAPTGVHGGAHTRALAASIHTCPQAPAGPLAPQCRHTRHTGETHRTVAGTVDEGAPLHCHVNISNLEIADHRMHSFERSSQTLVLHYMLPSPTFVAFWG